LSHVEQAQLLALIDTMNQVMKKFYSNFAF